MELLTQKELKEMMLLSAKKIEEHKEEINKINVFPVPDQDTGNNMAKTLQGIKEAIGKKNFKDLSEISEAALDGALTTAQGNAGVIYTGFLAGFLPLLDKNPVDAKKLAAAFEKGAERAKESIQNPKEGTILDVINTAAQTLKEESEKEKNIIDILKSVAEKSKEALLATREKMEIFRKANVVDAGGLAFLMILESYLEALEPSLAKAEAGKEKPSEKIRRFVQTLSNRFEVVALIKNPKFNEEAIRQKLKSWGNCLDIVRVKDKMKIHIHTDYPEDVKKIIREAGQILSLREEDMAREVVGEESVRRVSIGIVTDDVAMLLPKITEKYKIEILPIRYNWPEEKDLPGENIYQKMREAEKRGVPATVKTTQINPKQYLEAYQKQLKEFDKVLCITLSSKLSGCYNSALQAKEMSENPGKIFVLDSLMAASGQALLILKAVELIQEQREIKEILRELKELIPKIHTYVIFEDPKWIEGIGRITHSQANWVRRMKKINIHPLTELKNGLVCKSGVIFASSSGEALFKKVLKESKKARREGRKIRTVIGHADKPEEAENLKKLLKEKIKAEVSFIAMGPTVVCAAAGPGTLLVGWMAV
jgi:DegV family protein with EDD domain